MELDNHLCYSCSIESRITSNVSSEPCASWYWVMILIALRASFVLTIGHSLSNSQVLILVSSLLSSIVVWPHTAAMMSWSVGTSENVVMNREWIIKVSFNRIGNKVLISIPVTFVIVRACEIWLIFHLIYLISLIIVKETSNSWCRSPVNQLAQCYVLSQLNKAGNRLISYTWTAEHTSSLCNMNLYVMISDSKNRSRRSKYSDQYVIYLHKALHIWSHDHAEKSPWPLWVINGIKLHIKCIKRINNQQMHFIFWCIFIISSLTCFSLQSGHLQVISLIQKYSCN